MSTLSSFFSSLATSQTEAVLGGVVGVDIGSSAVKVVQLEQKHGRLTLSTYGELQLGPYADRGLGQAVTLTVENEQAALVDVIRESAVKADDAVFAMPLSSSFVTNVSIEAAQGADLAAMVRVEARKVIPASLSEVTLDWAEVEAVQTNKENKLETHNVLIAAIQNNALERFKVLMQFAGLKNPPTEIECFSAIRSLLGGKQTNVAILDIGATAAKLYIVKSGQLMRMHRVRAGGAVATQAIAKELNLEFEAAEEMKHTITRSDAQFVDVQRVHHASYERGFREFAQVIAEYEKKTDSKVELIHLTGGAAIFPGTDAFVRETLGRDVDLADPFSKVAYPAFMEDTVKVIGPSFTVALGAALRQFE
ncbi:type IV pilus assembly protein PilM [Candidatus Kaiserbacteria bacterium]|nr:type IV pilus assembly protein PilM [Candidatus Kaiserbacteria bacterium]